jgi:hypothetical protein
VSLSISRLFCHELGKVLADQLRYIVLDVQRIPMFRAEIPVA